MQIRDPRQPQPEPEPVPDSLQWRLARSVPAFHMECTVPRGMSSVSPGPQHQLAAADVRRQRALEHLEVLVLVGCQCFGGGCPPGSNVASISSSSGVLDRTVSVSAGSISYVLVISITPFALISSILISSYLMRILTSR